MVGDGSDGSGRNDAGQSQHVELLHEVLGDAGLCMGGYLLNRKCHLCSGNPTVSGAGIAWRAVERTSCSAGGLGDERICAKCDVTSWVGGKSCIFATEISSASAACFDHGSVGDELCVTAVSCCNLRLGCM
jgi:hypothetical protein